MGGVIAFEVARQLQARGERVALLALIDAKVQSTGQGQPSWYMLLIILALDLGMAGDKLMALMQEIKNLPPPGQLRRVWTETKRAGVVPAEMTLLEFRRLFDTFKANANMMLRYEAGNYAGRVTLLAAEQNFEKTIPGPWTVGSESQPPDPLLGWGRLVTGGIDLHVVPGNHFTMMKEPFVEALAERLRICIDEALRAPDSYSDLNAVRGSTFVARQAGK